MIPLDVAQLTVHETIGGEPEYQQKMLALYPEFFPEYAYYLPYMAHRMTLGIDSDAGFIERWWLIEIDGEVAGLRLFKYSYRRDCALVLGTAIRPKFRKYPIPGFGRLSEYIVERSAQQITADALAAHRPVPLGLVSEVQLPEPRMTPEEAAYHKHILDRYHEMGYIDLPVEYSEPPHITGRESYLESIQYEELPYNHMVLSVRPVEGGNFDPENRETTTNITLAYLTDHYRLPDDHWIVRRALESIDRYYGQPTHD